MNGDPEWRWADPSGQQRRVRTDELRAALSSGAIAPNTPVWRDGWTEWQSATDVPELTSSALSAANGVVPNIPPPPMNVVAAQHAFEGDAPARPSKEPPPPPKYIPLGGPPLHKPSQTLRDTGSPGQAPNYSVNANTAVNIRALNEGDAAALIAKPNGTKPNGAQGSAKARESQSPDQRETVPNPAPIPDGARPPQASRPSVKPTAPPPPSKRPPPPAIGLPSLVRTAPPPPVVRAVGSKPPPPPMSGRGGSKTPPPPPVEKAGREQIEELSGSVLLADTSGAIGAVGGASADNSIEELSGSILLPDQSGAIQTGEPREKSGALLLPDLSGPAPVVRGQSTPELTGNFLLDAGSTGALPSVESTGQILAAKAASRAPFAPAHEAAPPAPLPEHAGLGSPEQDKGRLTPAPIIPVAFPLGSYPPPPPNTNLGGPAPAPDLSAQTHEAPHAAHAAPAAPLVDGGDAPGLVDLSAHGPAPVPEAGPLSPAQATLLGVSPPPASLLEDPALAAQAPIAQPAPDPYAGPQPLPLPERSSARLHDFRALGHDPRARYALYGFGALGLLVALGIVGLIVSAVKKPSDDTAPVASASASAASTATAPAPSAPAAAPARTAGAVGGACTLAGAAHVIAPRAVVQSGVEASVVGSRLALGFAAREKEGYAVTIDPSSAVAEQTVRAHAPGPIRRLVPIQAAQGLGASADVDRESDFLGGRRTIPAQHPFDLGFGGGGLAWAPYRSAEVGLLWTLEGDDPVEAIRAAPLEPGREDAGWAIAFRRGATIYAGAVTGGASLTAKGQLVKVAGLGPQVGSPAVAAQDGAILVAWADRAQPSEPWSLRWMRFSPGEASAEAKAFVPSEGGLGEHAMSPAIAAAGQGRFVMAWTEGPVATHQVRAQTMTGSGAPLGTAMAISDSGVNAGQAQLAILPDGHGVVAYLAAAPGPKTSYEVLATPIVCP